MRSLAPMTRPLLLALLPALAARVLVAAVRTAPVALTDFENCGDQKIRCSTCGLPMRANFTSDAGRASHRPRIT